jgi:hypothetical protein
LTFIKYGKTSKIFGVKTGGSTMETLSLALEFLKEWRKFLKANNFKHDFYFKKE